MTKKLSIVLIALLFGGENLMAGNNYTANNYTAINQQTMLDPRIAALGNSITLLTDGLEQLQQSLGTFNTLALEGEKQLAVLFEDIIAQTVRLVAIAETSNANHNVIEDTTVGKISQINECLKDFDIFRDSIIGNKKNVLENINAAKGYFDANDNNMMIYMILDLPKHIEKYVEEQSITLTSEIEQINSANKAYSKITLAATPAAPQKVKAQKASATTGRPDANGVWSAINNALKNLTQCQDQTQNVHTIDPLLTDENVNTIINDIQIRSGISKIDEMTRGDIKDTFNGLINGDTASYVCDSLWYNKANITQSNRFLNKVPTDSCRKVSELLLQINDIDDKKEIQSIVLNNLNSIVNAAVDLLFWQIEKHDTPGRQLRNLTNLAFTVIANRGNTWLLLYPLLDNITTGGGCCQGYGNRFVLFLNQIFN